MYEKIRLLTILVLGFCISLYFLKHKRKRIKFILPKETINYKQFKQEVKNGDLLVTKASNNPLSLIHSIALGTPVAHVGIALVEKEGDESSQVFMFESGAPRGAQLRNLDDYMLDGADYLWWRPLHVSDSARQDVVRAMEFYNKVPYSWEFLKDLPKLIFSIEIPGLIDEGKQWSASCGDLVANVFIRAGLIKSKIKKWLPMNFIDDSEMNWEKNGSVFDEPINVIFNIN